MRPSGRSRHVCVTLVAALGAAQAVAGIAYEGGGTVEYRHTFEVNNPGTGTTNLRRSPVSSSSLSGTTHLNSVHPTTGSPRTTAIATAGYTQNSTTATFVLKNGTGVSQNDFDNALNGASELWIGIGLPRGTAPSASPPLTPMRWRANSPKFGPTATGYVSFTVAGTNPSGGTSSVEYNIEFRNGSLPGSPLLCPPVVGSASFGAGPFSLPITQSAIFSAGGNSGTLAIDHQLRLTGFINLRGNTGIVGDGGPEGPIESRVLITDIDIGGAPPTATYTGVGGTPWGNPGAWSSDIIPQQVPNQPGLRARLPDDRGVDRTIFLDVPTPLGTLDVDGSATTTINSFGVPFIFDSGDVENPAVVFHRNINGNGALTLNTPLQLVSPLEVTVDSAAGVTFNQQVVGGSNAFIGKAGAGPMNVNTVLQVPAVFVDGGAANFSVDQGAPLVLFQHQTLLSGSINYATSMHVADLNITGGTAHLSPSVTGNVLATHGLNINGPNAKLDLGRGGLVLDYDAGPSPLAAIVTLIGTGFAGGGWDGPGIKSVVAGSDSRLGIGYSDTALFPQGVFLNEPVDTTTVLARVTLKGDADLDGHVGIDDFARLALNFNGSGIWAQGDFNIDGVVDIDDFSELALNFNQVFSGGLPRSAAVPEPLAVAAALPGLVAVRRRRA